MNRAELEDAFKLQRLKSSCKVSFSSFFDISVRVEEIRAENKTRRA